MSIQLTVFEEDIVQGVLDSLATYLPAQLLSVENKYSAKDATAGRTVVLVPPQAYVASKPTQQLGGPVIFCYLTVNAQTTQGLQSFSDGWTEYELHASCEAHVSSDDAETANRIAMRYAEAMVGVFLEDSTLSGLAINVAARRRMDGKSAALTAPVVAWDLVIRFLPTY